MRKDEASVRAQPRYWMARIEAGTDKHRYQRTFQKIDAIFKKISKRLNIFMRTEFQRQLSNLAKHRTGAFPMINDGEQWEEFGKRRRQENTIR